MLGCTERTDLQRNTGTYIERCRHTEGRCCAAAPVGERQILCCNIKKSRTYGYTHTHTHNSISDSCTVKSTGICKCKPAGCCSYALTALHHREYTLPVTTVCDNTPKITIFCLTTGPGLLFAGVIFFFSICCFFFFFLLQGRANKNKNKKQKLKLQSGGKTKAESLHSGAASRRSADARRPIESQRRPGSSS